MTTNEDPKEGRVWPFIVGGVLVVVLVAPINLLAYLWCWSLSNAIFGPDTADNSGGLLLMLGVVGNVGLYLVLCAGSEAVFKLNKKVTEGGSFVIERRVSVLVVLLLQLGYQLWQSFAIGRHL